MHFSLRVNYKETTIDKKMTFWFAFFEATRVLEARRVGVKGDKTRPDSIMLFFYSVPSLELAMRTLFVFMILGYGHQGLRTNWILLFEWDSGDLSPLPDRPDAAHPVQVDDVLLLPGNDDLHAAGKAIMDGGDKEPLFQQANNHVI